MRSSHVLFRWFTASAITVSILFMAGCQKAPETKEKAIQAAIVPGADVYTRIDYRDARQTEIVKKIELIHEERRKGTGKSEESEKLKRRFEETTGLSIDDLLTVVISADADGVDFEGGDKQQMMQNLNAVLAVEFAKPLTREQLRAWLEVMVEEKGGAEISEADVDGTPVVTVTPLDPNAPTVYSAVSPDGDTVFITANTVSMQGALSRAGSGKTEDLPPELSAVATELPAGSQVQITFVTPEALQQKITEQVSKMEELAKEKPASGMFLGFVKPFQKIRSMAFGLKFGDEVEASIVSDLSGEQEALQAATLLQTMVIPMIQGALAKKGGEEPPNINERFVVKSNGSTLSLNLKLIEDDFTSMKTGEKAM